jgi:hypothetical protein
MGVLSPNGFPDVAVFSLISMPFDPNILWAGTEIGLFISEDAGSTWFLANNGLPNVGIFELKIMEDQVVVATQGRGVWSVALPELAEWVWPEITLAPRIVRFAMEPTGALALEIDLRSAYDSTVVVLDGGTLPTIEANSAPTTIEIPLNVSVAGTKTVSVTSHRDGKAYRTAPRSTFAFPTEVQTRYVNDFEDGSINNGEFAGSGFTVRVQFSFDSYAIHSSHPYPDNADLIFQLRRGIRVAAREATLSYRDVCLIEEGVSSDWTHPNFFDYVVVEGSRDGVTWLPLAPGYDSTADPTWLSVWRSRTDVQGNSLGQGSEALYRAHSIDLLESFDPGEVIFVRFRLHADAGVHGWGWAIDDLSIQANALSLGDEDGDRASDLPTPIVRLEQNVPNPFNPNTTIRYVLPERSMVRLDVYDLAGRRVRSLVREEQDAGEHAVTWNGTDERGRSIAGGTYLYRLHTGRRVLSRKMVLVE